MRRKIVLLAALLGLTYSALLAQDIQTTEPERRQIAENVFVDHSQMIGMVGNMDSLLIKENEQISSIFESDGRLIEEVYCIDFDKDGNSEYLIKMDSGGSGAYKDLCVLKKADKEYKPIWENTLSEAEVVIRTSDEAPLAVFVKHVDKSTDKPQNKVIGLTYSDGKVSEYYPESID